MFPPTLEVLYQRTAAPLASHSNGKGSSWTRPLKLLYLVPLTYTVNDASQHPFCCAEIFSMRHVAKALLSDRALLAGLFRQMTGIGGPKVQYSGMHSSRLSICYRRLCC